MDRPLKVILLGDPFVGKTSLAVKYVYNEFIGQYTPTNGVSFLCTDILVNDKRYRFDIWDTAGQEKYRGLVPFYARGASAALIVFDVTVRGSFENLGEWIQFVRDATSDAFILIFGNKTDCDDRQVTSDDLGTYCREREIDYYEGSALTGQGVTEAFTRIAEESVRTCENVCETSSAGGLRVTGPRHACC
jgi:Ras-related protein Rab-22